MDKEDLDYIYQNIHYEKNIYKNKVNYNLPDIHLEALKKSKFKYKFNPAKHRYQRTIDVLRKDGTNITRIQPPRYLSNGKLGYKILHNKLSTENLLNKFNIPTPKSKIYSVNEMEKARDEFYDENSTNAVIKPYSGTLGKGVMVNVTKDRFEFNWNELINTQKSVSKVIVQDYLEGFEARATIIEGFVNSITVRVPPFVEGDGEHSIKELIKIKNESRNVCTVLSRAKIKISNSVIEFLRSHDLNIDDIPNKGEYVLLNSVSNFSYGGELINVTDLVCDEIKETALNAVASIPGFYTAGVDLMMTSFDDKKPKVIELNSYPVLGIAAFPTYGPVTFPSKHYLNAVIARDQFINEPEDKYQVENDNLYLKNYFSFDRRRAQLYEDNANSASSLFLN